MPEVSQELRELIAEDVWLSIPRYLHRSIEAALQQARTPSPLIPGEVAVERWKGEVMLDLCEERNPGTDEFARGFNGGMSKARDMIYARLPALLASLTLLERSSSND